MNNRVLVIYRQRLGDIVACLPAARLIAKADNVVDFCCLPQYHPIFRAVSYCKPVGPEALKHRDEYAQVYDLEITRREYDAYRTSRIKWRDYVYSKYHELEPAANDRPLFDRMPSVANYKLPARYALAAPFGVSQVTLVDGDWIQSQCQSLSSAPWYVLVNKPGRETWGIPLYAQSLDHLPGLIAGATEFVTINSAPNIIAAGVRNSWHQIYEPGFGGQDNYDSPCQVVLHQPRLLARPSWRFRVHDWRRKLLGIAKKSDCGH